MVYKSDTEESNVLTLPRPERLNARASEIAAVLVNLACMDPKSEEYEAILDAQVAEVVRDMEAAAELEKAKAATLETAQPAPDVSPGGIIRRIRDVFRHSAVAYDRKTGQIVQTTAGRGYYGYKPSSPEPRKGVGSGPRVATPSPGSQHPKERR